MEWAFDTISSKVIDLFRKVLVPEIVNSDGLTLLKRGMGLLLDECNRAMPSPIWKEVAGVDWMGDAQQILRFLRDASEKWPAAERCQLTLSDVEEGQNAGALMLFLDSERLEGTSLFAQKVEDSIQNAGFDLQEWARWSLLVGFLGLILLEHLRPLELRNEYPEDGMICCAGIDDRIHLYLGIRSGGVFTSMVEWN